MTQLIDIHKQPNLLKAKVFCDVRRVLGASFPSPCTNPSLSLPLMLSSHSFIHHPFHPHQRNTPCLSVPHPFFHCLMLKMKAVQSLKTEPTTQHHIPEDLNLWQPSSEYLGRHNQTNSGGKIKHCFFSHLL